MTSYNIFDSEVYSEEVFPFTESEYDEVMQLAADDHGEPRDYEGYDDWLDTLNTEEREEIKDWIGGYSNNIPGPTYNGIDV